MLQTMSKNTSGGGMGLLGVLQVIFIVLKCVGVVEFYNGGFCINWYGKDGLMMPYGYDECAGEWGLFEVEPCSELYIEDLEVICNTHDNPEILKGDVSWRTLKKQQ